MILTTKRLILRSIALSDLGNIHALHSIPEVDKYNTLGIPKNIETTSNLLTTWIAEQQQSPAVSYIFCIDILPAKQFIGLIALKPGKAQYKTSEVWFKILPDYWGKGYATEALKEIFYFGFNNLLLHRIEAGCATDNLASAKVLLKAGMVQEGVKRKKLPIGGKWLDNYFFAILEEDFYGKT